MPINDGLTSTQREEMKDDLDLDPLRDVGSITEEEDEDGSRFTFQHKTIARYRIGRFEFKNHMLSIRSQKDYDEFIGLLREQPPYERLGIVELNPIALQNLERDPLAQQNRVMRGATDSAGTDPKFKSESGDRQGAHEGLAHENGSQNQSNPLGNLLKK